MKLGRTVITSILAVALFSASAFAEQPYQVPPMAKNPGDRCTILKGTPHGVNGNQGCCRAGFDIRPDGSKLILDGKEVTC